MELHHVYARAKNSDIMTEHLGLHFHESEDYSEILDRYNANIAIFEALGFTFERTEKYEKTLSLPMPHTNKSLTTFFSKDGEMYYVYLHTIIYHSSE